MTSEAQILSYYMPHIVRHASRRILPEASTPWRCCAPSFSGREQTRQKSSRMPQHSLSTLNGTSQSGLRSPTSTRSLIDPSASPASSAGSISPDAIGPFQMHTNPPSIAYVRRQSFSSEARVERHLTRALSHPRRRRSWEGSRLQRRKWTCLPGIGDPKRRKKAIGSLVSGTILGIMISTCEPRNSNIQSEPELICPYRPRACNLKNHFGPGLACRAHYVHSSHGHPVLPQLDPTFHACSWQQKAARSKIRSPRNA
jgi:hypothetical protein